MNQQMSKLTWPDLTLPPINLYNVPRLNERNMNNTLSPNYSFSVTEKENVQTITLLQVPTGKEKSFQTTAKSVDGLTSFMSSMSEDTCKPYFKGM